MPYVESAGARIWYDQAGLEEGPVLVLSHPLGASSGIWKPQVDVLGERFRLLLYDHRGHGKSGAPPVPWGIEDFGADVLALVDHLALKRVHFCGISLGGMAGLWLAQHAAGRLGRLVVSNTAAKIEDPALLRRRIALIQREGLDAIVDDVMERWFTDAFRASHRDVVIRFREMVLGGSASSYAATSEAICRMDLRAGLAAIETPTLVVCGKHDLATPPAWGRAIASAIPGAALLDLDAAHLSNVEASEAFSAAVSDFLTTNAHE